jgi:predicted O-methyltransferase YrrM
MSEMNTMGIRDLENYSKQHSKPLHPLLEQVRDYTLKHTSAPQMMVGELEGKFLHHLNQKLTMDSRVDNFLLPLRDGIQVVQKVIRS